MPSDWDERPASPAPGSRLRLAQDPPRPEKLGLTYPLLLFALIVAATAMIVDNRTRLVDGSYRIETLRQRLAELQMRNRQLQLEISSLAASEELHAAALQLGLKEPAAGQVHLVPAAEEAKPGRSPRPGASSATPGREAGR